MKLCYTCGEEKPLDMFYKKKSSKDGHSTLCKYCKKLKDKEYYESNKDKILILAEKYRSENKESISEYKKEYYSIPENKAHKSESDRAYRENNREYVLQRKKGV